MDGRIIAIEDIQRSLGESGVALTVEGQTPLQDILDFLEHVCFGGEPWLLSLEEQYDVRILAEFAYAETSTVDDLIEFLTEGGANSAVA